MTPLQLWVLFLPFPTRIPTSSLSVSPSMDNPPSHLLASSTSDRSQTVSPIRLTSPSPVTPSRPDTSHSPYSSGNLTVVVAGLGAASLTFDLVRAAEMNELCAQLRDECRHDLRLEFQSLAKTSDSEFLLRAELLHFKKTCVHMRSASRSWNLYAPRDHNYYHHYFLIYQYKRPW
jgi:hypothetical protein